MTNEVPRELSVGQRRRAVGRAHYAVKIVVVSGYALPFIAQYTSPFLPTPQPVGDHHLVPKGAPRLDSDNLRNGEVERGRFLCNAGSDRDWPIGVER